MEGRIMEGGDDGGEEDGGREEEATLLKIGSYSNTPALYCQDMGC